MKRLFLSLLLVTTLAGGTALAQAEAIASVINVTGNSDTEQASKLELIRVLQERLNKLTVSQLNARLIVSRGVTDYYKVDEIFQMQQSIQQGQNRYMALARTIGQGGGLQGSPYVQQYITQLSGAGQRAKILKNQLETVLRSGRPISLPSLPSFNISASNSEDLGTAMTNTINGVLSNYKISSEEELKKLPQAKQDEINAKIKEAVKPLMDRMTQSIKDSGKGLVASVGNMIGTAFGVPGAGSMLVGLTSGDVSSLAGLVGSITDNFQIPLDYYDSNTLKLTDAERLKLIDELHARMSDINQQVTALGTSLSTSTKQRYDEIQQPRNESIMYGPKRP